MADAELCATMPSCFSTHMTDCRALCWRCRVAAGERRRLPQHWPPQLAALVAECLAGRPAKRPSALQVHSQLHRCFSAQAAAQLSELCK
jgi:hypothetical protein